MVQSSHDPIQMNRPDKDSGNNSYGFLFGSRRFCTVGTSNEAIVVWLEGSPPDDKGVDATNDQVKS